MALASTSQKMVEKCSIGRRPMGRHGRCITRRRWMSASLRYYPPLPPSALKPPPLQRPFPTSTYMNRYGPIGTKDSQDTSLCPGRCDQTPALYWHFSPSQEGNRGQPTSSNSSKGPNFHRPHEPNYTILYYLKYIFEQTIHSVNFPSDFNFQYH